MKLSEVIALTAFYLKIKSYEADAERLSLLTKCANLVYRASAREYLPLYFTETAEVSEQAMQFRSLARNVIRIKSVTDETGIEVAYAIRPDCLATETGRIVVTYAYLPDEAGYEDELDYTDARVDVSLLAYGTAAEYCLINGLYEDAGIWDARYRAAVMSAARPRNGVKLPGRRWT
ncbi:MAG: hypothetical protein LBS99_04705 [Clostridiales bacterium]|jgi:hypothetical protein|nr:hypothetical protein [Clostridiales bacterium]